MSDPEPAKPDDTPSPSDPRSDGAKASSGDAAKKAAQAEPDGNNADGKNAPEVNDSDERYDPHQDRRDRWERERGKRNFSASVAGERRSSGNWGTTAMGDGSHAFGTVNGNVIIAAQARAGTHASIISHTSIKELAESFVPWSVSGESSFDELLRELTAQVCVLAGPVGSGRTALALCALHELLPKGELARFDTDVPVGRLDQEDFASADGYVLDASSAVLRRGLRAVVDDIVGLLKPDSDTRVVLVIGEAVGERAVERVAAAGLVRHQRPDPMVVLAALLTRRYRLRARFVDGKPMITGFSELGESELTADHVRQALPDGVVGSIDSATMEQVAVMAAAIAGAVADDIPPEKYLRSSVRQWVRSRLLSPLAQDGDREPDPETAESAELPRGKSENTLLFHRCFLLSAAVFNGLPLRTVLDQTIELTRIISRGAAAQIESADQSNVLAPFSRTSPQLLSGIEADEDRPDPGAADATEGRPLWFKNPAVPDVVLEVVWTDHHLASGAVLTWLRETAVVRRDRAPASREVQTRAAQAVGRLAAYDFDQIMTVIEGWAKDGTVSGRRATALAMDVMLQDGAIAPQTWARLRDWSMNWGLTRRLAALTVYAVTLDIEHVDDALDLLSRSRFQKRYATLLVAHVVCRIYELDLTDQVRDLLGEWIRELDRAVTTARSLRRSARLIVPSPLPGHLVRILLFLGDDIASKNRERLVRQIDSDPVMRTHVLVLWRMAVKDRGVVRFALSLLATWIQDADQEPLLEQACRRILRDLQRDRMGRDQLAFHARRWRDTWVRDFPHARELLDEELIPRGPRQ